MLIYVRGFEKKHKDKIAVIYELGETKKPVKVNYYKQIYYLDPFKEYLVICGLSEYNICGNKVECTFMSKKHPLYVEK
jgi:hypothetical protein